MATIGCLAAWTLCATAQTLRFEPGISAEIQFTDNVDLAPSDERRSDVVTQITPTLHIFENGAHTSLRGSIGLPLFFYARSGGSNTILPEVDLQGTAELYPRLVFVDASIQVAPTYFSAFGARPQNLANTTSNRYTSQSYRVSPYLKGDGRNNLHYLLRDDNVWTAAANTPVSANGSYENDITAQLSRDPTPAGWALDYSRNDTRFHDQEPLVAEAERAHVVFQPSYQWQWSLHAGYEDNRYPLANYSGAIYGVAFRWHPSEHASANALWEHRFFGSSYYVTADYRTPLSVWSLRAVRDTTTYPQQIAGLGTGGDVTALLEQILTSRFPDPVQRRAFIEQLIRDRNLPPSLSTALASFTQQVQLQESFQASVGLLGARNSVFVSAYRDRNAPIVSVVSDIPNIPSSFVNNTQVGTNIVWTHTLTALYSLTTNADWSRTTGNGDLPGKSTQTTFSSTLRAALSPRTDVYAGARYQRLVSDIQSGYHEAAAFIGITHTFK